MKDSQFNRAQQIKLELADIAHTLMIIDHARKIGPNSEIFAKKLANNNNRFELMVTYKMKIEGFPSEHLGEVMILPGAMNYRIYMAMLVPIEKDLLARQEQLNEEFRNL